MPYRRAHRRRRPYGGSQRHHHPRIILASSNTMDQRRTKQTLYASGHDRVRLNPTGALNRDRIAADPAGEVVYTCPRPSAPSIRLWRGLSPQVLIVIITQVADKAYA
jgi:hypothetical protein